MDAGAWVGPLAVVGSGSIIGSGCRIGSGACIGSECRVGEGTLVEPRAVLLDKEHLSEEANVFVVAPNSQKSAAGHGITISKPVFVKECHFPKAYMAFEVHGTPADCVKVGLRILEEKGVEIDMVYSGINHGANLGTDTLYSGTVSALMNWKGRSLTA